MKHDFHTLTTNMRSLRILAEDSQEYTAANLHISRSTYAAYETGQHVPDLDVLQRFSDLYHVSLSDLVCSPMDDLILLQINYRRHRADLDDVLRIYEKLPSRSKAFIIAKIKSLKQEEELISSLYHICHKELTKGCNL